MSADPTETPRRRYLVGALRWARRVATTAILSSALGYVGLIVLGYEPMTIVTGSMQKTIPVGSLVVSHPVAPDTLEVGDVISFQKPIGAPGLDTHRIVSIKSEGGKRFYQTKGDSNPIVDPWVLSFDAGADAHKTVFHVPYVGNALLFARSSVGRILLIGYVCFTLLFSIFKGMAVAAKQKEEAAAVAVPLSSDGETPPGPSQADEAAAGDPESPEHTALSPRAAAPRVASASHRPLAPLIAAVAGILLVAVWYRSRRR